MVMEAMPIVLGIACLAASFWWFRDSNNVFGSIGLMWAIWAFNATALFATFFLVQFPLGHLPTHGTTVIINHWSAVLHLHAGAAVLFTIYVLAKWGRDHGSQ